jgi:Flp pilus assembly protein TadG
MSSASAGVPGAGSRGGVLRRLHADRSGAVGMMFGLLVVPLTAVVGLAVDYGRAYAVKSHTQAALDAAALAAGRVGQTDKTSSALANAEKAAKAYFDEAKPLSVVESTLQFSPNSQKTEFTVTATSWVRTPFLGVLQILFKRDANAAAPAGCTGSFFSCISMTTTATAKFNAGLNGGSNVELVMMLDVTGSMCSPCSKITDLKAAAKDLVDIVVWDDQSTYKSRIALAPFAQAVNVGATLAPLVRGDVTSNSSSSPQVFNNSSMTNTSIQPTSTWIRFPRASSGWSNPPGCDDDRCTWRISNKCVTERIGAHAYTDAAPSTAFVGKGYFGTDGNTSCGVANYSDAEVNLIMPLSSDRTALKTRLDKMSTGGSTAGHLGTAWAYYLLSPNWNYLFPSASAAGPYSDLTSVNTSVTPPAPKLKKIAVLMTDGEYNINYCKGVEAKNSDQSPDINCNSENGKSLSQATSICSAMKQSKIEVFTVGFQVNSTAKTFLQNCATDASHFYDATTGEALKQAFRDIALKAVPLQLTQ